MASPRTLTAWAPPPSAHHRLCTLALAASHLYEDGGTWNTISVIVRERWRAARTSNSIRHTRPQGSPTRESCCSLPHRTGHDRCQRTCWPPPESSINTSAEGFHGWHIKVVLPEAGGEGAPSSHNRPRKPMRGGCLSQNLQRT